METPTITSSYYGTGGAVGGLMVGAANALAVDHDARQKKAAEDAVQRAFVRAQQAQQAQQAQPKPQTDMTARIVKVFIADSNDNLPLDKRVLYSGPEKLTDLTDQELYFEVPIAELLERHNAVRVKTLDKRQSEKFGRDIYMEPARIRDLKMVVVNVAQF